MSGIGATSPERWQLAHLLKMIGATSLLKVTLAASFRFLLTAAAAVSIMSRTMNKRFMISSSKPPPQSGKKDMEKG